MTYDNNKVIDITNNNKRQYEEFNLEFIYNNMYLPSTRGENIKTSKSNKTMFLKYLRQMGEVVRRYSKDEGTSYILIPNKNKGMIDRKTLLTIMTYYPISEMSLLTLYFRFLEGGVDISIIEDILEVKNYMTNDLGFTIDRYVGKMIDFKLLKK